MKKIALLIIVLNSFACNQAAIENGSSHHPFHPEWSKHSNIYEVNIRQYTPEGTFNAFEKHLPRLKELGVDILWLMPIQPIGKIKRKGILGSYYSISDYSAINPEFGSKEDFLELVKTSHNLGIRVILDWVPNHTSWDHHWMSESPDFYFRDPQTGIISNGLDDHNNPTDWTDVAELDYDNPAMQEEMRQEMLWWIEEFDIDGFRCDMAGGQSDEFWEKTILFLRGVKKELFMLAESEHLPLHNSGFDMTYGWEFHHLLNKVAGDMESVKLLDDYLEKQRTSFPQDGYRMYFIDNHDENSWNGTVKSRIGDNAHPAFILCCTMLNSMPLIYSGQEVGLDKSLRFFSRDTISWETPSQEKFYSKALSLKRSQNSLANGNWGGTQDRILVENNSVYAFYRSKGSNKVVVFINFSDEQIEINYKNSIKGKFKNWFTGDNITLKKNGTLTLGPNDFRVFTKA